MGGQGHVENGGVNDDIPERVLAEEVVIEGGGKSWCYYSNNKCTTKGVLQHKDGLQQLA